MNIIHFNFEELKVWGKAVDYANEVIKTVDLNGISAGRKHYRLVERLESACTSVALALPKGKAEIQKENSSSSFILPGVLYLRGSLCWSFSKETTG